MSGSRTGDNRVSRSSANQSITLVIAGQCVDSIPAVNILDIEEASHIRGDSRCEIHSDLCGKRRVIQPVICTAFSIDLAGNQTILKHSEDIINEQTGIRIFVATGQAIDSREIEGSIDIACISISDVPDCLRTW